MAREGTARCDDATGGKPDGQKTPDSASGRQGVVGDVAVYSMRHDSRCVRQIRLLTALLLPLSRPERWPSLQVYCNARHLDCATRSGERPEIFSASICVLSMVSSNWTLDAVLPADGRPLQRAPTVVTNRLDAALDLELDISDRSWAPLLD